MGYTLVDMGIALAHFDLACGAENVTGSWELFEDEQPELRATLRVPDDVRLVAVRRPEARAGGTPRV